MTPLHRFAVALILCLPAIAGAQETPNPYDQAALRVRIAQLQLEIARNRDERQRLEVRLRELQAAIDRANLERERLAAEEARLLAEAVRLSSQLR